MEDIHEVNIKIKISNSSAVTSGHLWSWFVSAGCHQVIWTLGCFLIPVYPIIICFVLLVCLGLFCKNGQNLICFATISWVLSTLSWCLRSLSLALRIQHGEIDWFFGIFGVIPCKWVAREVGIWIIISVVIVFPFLKK